MRPIAAVLTAVLCYGMASGAVRGEQPAAASRTPPPGITTVCRVLSVHDGDTLTVEVRRTIQVRLLDCWADEISGKRATPQGLRARDHLRAMVDGREALLHIPASDRNRIGDVITFGRVLGRIYIDGVDVSEQMVADGFATATR